MTDERDDYLRQVAIVSSEMLGPVRIRLFAESIINNKGKKVLEDFYELWDLQAQNVLGEGNAEIEKKIKTLSEKLAGGTRKSDTEVPHLIIEEDFPTPEYLEREYGIQKDSSYVLSAEVARKTLDLITQQEQEQSLQMVK